MNYLVCEDIGPLLLSIFITRSSTAKLIDRVRCYHSISIELNADIEIQEPLESSIAVLVTGFIVA